MGSHGWFLSVVVCSVVGGPGRPLDGPDTMWGQKWFRDRPACGTAYVAPLIG